MSCDKNCRRIITGGVAFGAGISRTASQSGFVAGVQGATVVVHKGSPGATRGMPCGDLPKTRLEPSRVRLILDAPDVQQLTSVIVQNGYVVLRASGRETGLAVIPGLKRLQSPDGSDIFQEDTGQWWVLHVDSGRTLSSRGYKSPQEAQMLASALARRRDWTMDADELTIEDLKAARALIDQFDNSC